MATGSTSTSIDSRADDLMGRGRDFRGGGSGRGRPAHDEDHDDFLGPPAPYPPNPSVRRPSAGDGNPSEAIEKWFNHEKGFGFVEMADGSGDAFLSAKALQAFGRESVLPDAKLNVLVGQGEKGRHVTKITAIAESATSSTPSNGPSYPISPKRHEVDSSSAKEAFGKVKWFSVEKGMGFVEADDGGKDVFVQISVVKKAQMPSLSEGQRISMQVTETPKGRQAVSITAVD
jgi:CspA family cold shock protein